MIDDKLCKMETTDSSIHSFEVLRYQNQEMTIRVISDVTLHVANPSYI